MSIKKEASNQTGGSFESANSISINTSNWSNGRLRRVTKTTKEFDAKGNCIKEVTETTEYEKDYSYYPDQWWQRPNTNPYPYTVTYSGASASGGRADAYKSVCYN